MNSFEHEGLYTCKCGKQFTKSQSFNAHKSNCIEILGKDRYEKKLEISKAGLKKATQVAADNAKRKRQELLDLWMSKQYTCEKCGKVMTEKYASGRFCSQSCAKSRDRGPEVCSKISQGVIKAYQKKLLSGDIDVSPNDYVHTGISGYFKGIKFDSSWELAFLIWAHSCNHIVVRNHEAFIYKDSEEKLHQYIPDYKINDIYYEIKGRYTEITYDKIKQFPENKILIIIDDTDIGNYLSIAEELYGKNWIIDAMDK